MVGVMYPQILEKSFILSAKHSFKERRRFNMQIERTIDLIRKERNQCSPVPKPTPGP